MPRKYKKKSDYWNKFDKKEAPIEELTSSLASDTSPILAGENFYAEAVPNCVHNYYHILDLQEKLIGNYDEKGKLKNVAINKNKNWRRIRDVD